MTASTRITRRVNDTVAAEVQRLTTVTPIERAWLLECERKRRESK